jgi:hypothetical protein
VLTLVPPPQYLQGGSEKLSDEAIDETLDKVVKLLAYISDKDLFAEFYRKRLARRLLQVRGRASGHRAMGVFSSRGCNWRLSDGSLLLHEG